MSPKTMQLHLGRESGHDRSMLQRVRGTLQEISAYLGFWPFIGGSALMAVLSGWAAHATALLTPYAPLSWIVAGLGGALAFVVVAWIAVAIRNGIISGTIRRRFYEQTDRINPLDTQFHNQRIKLADLMPPTGSEIEGKSFVGCEIIGPSNIAIRGSHLTGCNFAIADAVLVKEGANVKNALAFRDCHFSKCKFYWVTLLVPEKQGEEFERGIPGLIWLNPSPPVEAT